MKVSIEIISSNKKIRLNDLKLILKFQRPLRCKTFRIKVGQMSTMQLVIDIWKENYVTHLSIHM